MLITGVIIWLTWVISPTYSLSTTFQVLPKYKAHVGTGEHGVPLWFRVYVCLTKAGAYLWFCFGGAIFLLSE